VSTSCQFTLDAAISSPHGCMQVGFLLSDFKVSTTISCTAPEPPGPVASPTNRNPTSKEVTVPIQIVSIPEGALAGKEMQEIVSCVGLANISKNCWSTTCL
jgi:hypothetical protein